MNRCEERLRQLHPEAMRRYDELRHQGGAEAAMQQAAPLFATPPAQPGAIAPGQANKRDLSRTCAADRSPEGLAAHSYPYPITTALAARRGNGGHPSPGRQQPHDLRQHPRPAAQRRLQPR